MPEENENQNPFDFPHATAAHKPALQAAREKIAEQFKTLDPARAAVALEQVEQAIAEKQSAKDTLETIFGIIGTAVEVAL